MMKLQERLQAKRLLVLFFLFVSVAVLAGCNNSAGQSVAEVNGEPILKEDFYQAMVNQGGEQLLDQMITEKLLQQEVEKKQIQVTDDMLEAELAKMKEQFGGEEAFQSSLLQYGVSEEMLREDLRTQVMLRELLAPQVQVTEEEIRQYFEQNKAVLGQEERVRARHILVDSEETAKEVLDKLNGGASFEELAKEYGTDGTKDKGGDLGFFGRGEMVKEFEDVAFSLSPGETSGIVKSEFGFHIIRVEERQEEKAAVYEEEKEQIEALLIDQKVAEKAPSYLEELKAQAEIVNKLKS